MHTRTYTHMQRKHLNSVINISALLMDDCSNFQFLSSAISTTTAYSPAGTFICVHARSKFNYAYDHYRVGLGNISIYRQYPEIEVMQ